MVWTAVRKRMARSRSFRRAYGWYAFQRFAPTALRRNALRLHLGCGNRLLDGWINIDAGIRANVLTMQLPRGLRRFPAACARYIYASHLLEHLQYPDEATAFAEECHRILIPGGVVRIVVPGIEKIIRAYVADNQAFFAIQASLHPAWCTTKLEHLLYALQQDGTHRYGYDFATLRKLLRRAGFADVVLSDYNASVIAALRVDYRGIRDDAGGYLSLFVEATK
jgi:predicted SAM-dependent methyltransferase